MTALADHVAVSAMHDSPTATVQWRRAAASWNGDDAEIKWPGSDGVLIIAAKRLARSLHSERSNERSEYVAMAPDVAEKPERRRCVAARNSVSAPTLSLRGLRVVRTMLTPNQLPRRSRAYNNKRAERREGAECASGCVVRAEAPQAARPERSKGEQCHEVHCWCYRLDRRSQER